MVGNWWKNWQSMEMWGKGRIYLKMAGVQRWKYGHQWEQEEIRSNLDNKNSRCKLSRMIGTNKIILQYIPYITGLLLTSVPASHSLQGGHFPWALFPPCSIFPFNVFVSNLSPICLHLFFLLRCVCVCVYTNSAVPWANWQLLRVSQWVHLDSMSSNTHHLSLLSEEERPWVPEAHIPLFHLFI